MFSLKDKKIIINVDTGIDDALAIILLCRYFPNNILGISTCGGNVDLDLVTENSLAILSLLGLSVPVYSGSKKTVDEKEYISAFDYHGNNGICNIEINTNKKEEPMEAKEFIIESSKKY
mgnify:CR=1 FL=1